MMNNGPQGERPWFLPNDPQGSAPPKSAPGDGLKAFASSGALGAFENPMGATEDKQQGDMGPQLMAFLKMMGM